MIFVVIVYGSSITPYLHGVFSSENLAKKSVINCRLLDGKDNILLIGKVEVDAVNDLSIPVEDVSRDYLREV